MGESDARLGGPRHGRAVQGSSGPILDTRLSTQIAEMETRLKRWIVGTVLATATLTVWIFRLFGRFP